MRKCLSGTAIAAGCATLQAATRAPSSFAIGSRASIRAEAELNDCPIVNEMFLCDLESRRAMALDANTLDDSVGGAVSAYS